MDIYPCIAYDYYLGLWNSNPRHSYFDKTSSTPWRLEIEQIHANFVSRFEAKLILLGVCEYSPKTCNPQY